MTAPAPNPTPTTPPGSSPTPPSGTPGAETATPPPASAEAWKAGPGAGAFAGKTAEEILGLVQQQAQLIQQQQQWIQQQQARPEPPVQPSNSFDLDDDDYVKGSTLKRIAAQFQQQQPQQQQYVNQALLSTANLALGLAESRNPDVFRRWGTEVRGLLTNVPPHLQTLDNIQLIVDTVRGRHVEELAQERAQELASKVDPTMRSLGGAGSGSAPNLTTQAPTVLDNPSIPEAYRQRLKEQGLTDRQIVEFCDTQGMKPEEFVKLFGTNVVAGG